MKGRNKSTWILADPAISVSLAAPNSTHSSLLFSCLPLSQHSPVRSSWPQSWIHSSRDSPILWRQQMLAASLEESFLAWICQSFDKHPSLDIIQLCFRVSREFSLCSKWANSLQGEKNHTFSDPSLEKCVPFLCQVYWFTWVPKMRPTGLHWKDYFFWDWTIQQ